MIPPQTHSRAVGKGAPRQGIQPNMIAPAIRKRQPAINIGGQDSTPMRITR
ncbi:hypothetical protein D3C80_1589690 [compost metagenome]